MLIRDLLNQGTPSFSFEFFPPKTDEGFDRLMETIRELQKLHPTFVSVTYGAGGSTRRRSIDVVAKAKGELGQESMAHLTCVGSTEEELRDVLDERPTHHITSQQRLHLGLPDHLLVVHPSHRQQRCPRSDDQRVPLHERDEDGGAYDQRLDHELERQKAILGP